MIIAGHHINLDVHFIAMDHVIKGMAFILVKPNILDIFTATKLAISIYKEIPLPLPRYFLKTWIG
jgi:sortase (surface protein transpeptidase)